MYVGPEKYVGMLVFLGRVFPEWEGCLGEPVVLGPHQQALSSGEKAVVFWLLSHSLPQCLHKQYPGILPLILAALPPLRDVVYLSIGMTSVTFFCFCFDKLF